MFTVCSWFIFCIATVPTEALCCAVVGTVLRVAFLSTVRVYVITLHVRVGLSVCVVCLPHYCVFLCFYNIVVLTEICIVK